MTEIFLGIIAIAALIGCMGIFLVGFICFHMIYGYREWLPSFMDWYIDEVLPKQMKKTTDALFGDLTEDDEEPTIEEEAQ